MTMMMIMLDNRINTMSGHTIFLKNVSLRLPFRAVLFQILFEFFNIIATIIIVVRSVGSRLSGDAHREDEDEGE